MGMGVGRTCRGMVTKWYADRVHTFVTKADVLHPPKYIFFKEKKKKKKKKGKIKRKCM